MGDYDLDLQYHPGKVNVVLDALSRKPSFMMMTRQMEMHEEILRLDLQIILPRDIRRLMTFVTHQSLSQRSRRFRRKTLSCRRSEKKWKLD